MTTESDVDDFLKERPRSGQSCESCKLSNIKQINQAILHFIRLRAAGDTTVAMSDFHRYHLKSKLSYPLGETSLRRHIRNCLD